MIEIQGYVSLKGMHSMLKHNSNQYKKINKLRLQTELKAIHPKECKNIKFHQKSQMIIIVPV